MEDNSSDSDQNTSSFPLFNFEALKHSFPEVPHAQLNCQPFQTEKDVLSKESDAESSKTNKSSKPKKSKKSQEAQNEKVTMKDILEDVQSGIPMEADLKMKEDKLQKMREGKQRKKLQRQQASSNPSSSDQIEKAFQSINNMTSITNIPQTLFNIPPSHSGGSFDSVGQIVLKDGKPVVQLSESTKNTSFANTNLITVKSDKPKRLSSLSFRKNNYTKHWTPDETRKFYKGLEIFGSDFSMIAKLFADRDRMQIKNKLRKEERQHPKKVEDAFKKT